MPASSDAGVPDLGDRVGVSEEGVADEFDDVQRSSSRVLVTGSVGIGHDDWDVTIDSTSSVATRTDCPFSSLIR
jgi:hypothetical protein